MFLLLKLVLIELFCIVRYFEEGYLLVDILFQCFLEKQSFQIEIDNRFCNFLNTCGHHSHASYHGVLKDKIFASHALTQIILFVLLLDDKCDLNKTVILMKTYHQKRKGWDFLMNCFLEQWQLYFLVRLEFDQYSNPPRALFVQSKHNPCKNLPIGNSRDWNTWLAVLIIVDHHTVWFIQYEMRDISHALSQIFWMEYVMP